MSKVFSIFLAIFFVSSMTADETKTLVELKRFLDERLWECEEHKKVLVESSDIYTYYLIYGRQAAYQEVMILIDRLEKSSNEVNQEMYEKSEGYDEYGEK